MARCHYDAKHDAKPSAESRPVRKTSPPRNRTSSTSDSSDEFRWMCAHAAFVPTLVLSRIASNPMAKAEAYQETFPAAVLFVDIAGYVRLSGATHAGVARRETRLGITSRGWEKNRGGDNDKRCGKKDDDDETEARSKENSSSRVAGLAGEAMRDLVSACFASVVSTVHKHGGDVVKFAGDALFAVWKAEPRFGETLGEACLRATQCGVEIQDASQSSKAVCTARQISVRDEPCERRYEKDIPPKALRLKVVVGAGTVKGIHVGGVDDRWEYLISGDPVAQIGRDQKIATPGTVVVSREMMLLETMRDHCVVVEVGCMLDATVDAEEDTNGREVRDTEKTSQDPHETQGKVLSRSRSGKSIFPLFSGGSIGTNGSGLFSPRSTHGFRRKSTETAFRVTGLTNGFDDAPVEYFFKPRRGVNREAIVKRVLDKDKDLLQPLIKAVSRYVPKCVTTASQENNTGRGGLSLYQNMWRGEIRRCAVVFLDVRMSNVSEVEFVRNRCLLQASSTAMEITQKTLKRLDGSLRQFLVDDKGSVIIAVFGLPGMAHHDDAERAVRFATTTISWLEKNGGLKNAKAGVTFGDVFCGAVGPATRYGRTVFPKSDTHCLPPLGERTTRNVLRSCQYWQL
jgi:class 3 adenylate cyclase